MPQPLDYETPVAAPRPQPKWYQRTPLIVLFVLPIASQALLGVGGKLLPGERLPHNELLMQAMGHPIALSLALISFSTSSTRRRVGLIIAIALASLLLIGNVQFAIEHW